MNFSNRGITLIEIFVVITITTIVLAVAIPNFSKYVKKYGVEKEITEIYGDLVEQRFKSMNSGVPNGIRFDSATQYTLFEFNDTTKYDMKYAAGEEKDPVQKSGLKFDLEKKGGAIADTVVLFDERGMARNKDWFHGGFTLHVKNSPKGTRCSCIKVYWTRIKTGMWDSASNECKVK
jgi:type II secretory pathway pseudopilin PulG